MTNRERRAGKAELSVVPKQPKPKPPEVKASIGITLLSTGQVRVMGPLKTHAELCREMLREALRVVNAAEAENRVKILAPMPSAIVGPDGKPLGGPL